MKKPALILVLIFALGSLGFGQNLVGPISGVLGPGTYYIVGDVAVTQNDTLIIQPGTTFLADSGCVLGVYGYIYAVGTEQDSIKFMAHSAFNWWDGIDFKPSTNPSSRLEYCLVTRSETQGLEIFGCSPTISHCTIYDNNPDSDC